ncbi:MAG TPA: uroporphyrinogen decarboxylase family protein [Armatimonadota bacterium]|jgi:uroporphyrinogen-III decarboxylase|nr:uroporphyrinogen decarboxylase family protein [Armatimonadota bacterium]
MTGRERVACTLAGESIDRLPVLPILHTGFATILGVPLGDFFSSAETMARVMVEGCREFGFDGVQLSSGVTAEMVRPGHPASHRVGTAGHHCEHIPHAHS